MTEGNLQLEDWLDDLCVRFIMNVPREDLSTVERICFQMEEAQWYYEDFIRPLDPRLPIMNLRTFCARMFAHCPLFAPFSKSSRMQAFEKFVIYKLGVPVRGAIMLNEAMDQCVLVKGWKKSAGWGFPKGKINLEEDDLTCAVREVYEETGFDLEAQGFVDESSADSFIERNLKDNAMRLYVFKGIPVDTHFQPRTRKEISDIKWWKLSDLPAYRNKNRPEDSQAPNSNKFFLVAPFLVDLRKWIIKERKMDGKRMSSNQYLSAGMSHDEGLAEDGPGADSTGPAPMYTTQANSMQDIATLAGDTAALNRLLKAQQHGGGGLEAPPSVPSPPSFSGPPAPPAASGPNSGTALLALLHGKTSTDAHTHPRNAPPQTPQDHELMQPTMPRSPHHHRPPPPNFSQMPPPPNFPIPAQSQPFPAQNQPFSYQQAPSYQQMPPPPQQHSNHGNFANTFPRGNPHYNQPPHLVHPQPLPPHVQRAVFNGGPVHAPIVPQPIQQRPHQLDSNASVPMPNPHFPGLHSTMVPEVRKQSPPKLTSHSLNLLNAFKNRDQDAGGAAASSDLPLRRFTQGAPPPPPPPAHRSQPQELPGDESQAGERYPEVSFLQSHNTNIGMNEKLLAAKQAISERQKSTLLDLFKSPTTATTPDPPQRPAQPAKPLSATALPTSDTPSAVELSAVEPLSNLGASRSRLPNRRRVSNGPRDVIPEMNPEANLPYRAHAILTRPSELSEQDLPIREDPPHRNRDRRNTRKQAPPTSDPESKPSSPERHFRPQILKRPQQASARIPPAAVSPPTEHISPAVSRPPPAQIPRQAPAPPVNQSNAHKQTLLSLFGKSVPAAAPLSRESPNNGLTSMPPLEPTTSNSSRAMPPPHDPGYSLSAAARSRVGSLASGDGNPRRTNHTPISPANQGFLLDYLEGVVKSAQR